MCSREIGDCSYAQATVGGYVPDKLRSSCSRFPPYDSAFAETYKGEIHKYRTI